MADSAFKTAPFAAYTTKELTAALGRAEISDDTSRRMVAEIARRAQRDAGDVSVMYPAERLRFAKSRPDREQRFSVGTQFMSSGKHPVLCTVVDVLVTRNLAGEMVAMRYVAEHQFCGQMVRDYDVVDATIAKGKLKMEAA
jgi:hypothetical protein